MSWFIVEEEKTTWNAYEVKAETGEEAERIVRGGSIKPGYGGVVRANYKSEVTYKTRNSPSTKGKHLETVKKRGY